MAILNKRGGRRLVLGITALLAAGLGLAWWVNSRDADPLVRARGAYRQGKMGRALLWVNEALEQRPHDAQAREFKRRVMAEIGRPRSDASPAPNALSAASKQTAREHLQAARPNEARDELERLLTRGPDRETNWLMSRALLQQGEWKLAAAALKASGGFGDDDPTTAEPATLAGSETCARCHPNQYRSQTQSRHARTLLMSSELSGIPLPERPVQDPGNIRVSHAFHRDQDGLRVETRVGATLYDALVEFAVGSGDRGTSFIGRDPQGQPRLLRISTFDHHTKIDLTPSAPPETRDPSDFLGMRIHDSLLDCLGCHSTKVTKFSGQAGLKALDRGISCERCHGPAGNHLKAVEAHFPDLAIARPRLASAKQIVTLCGQCHQPLRGQITPESDPTLVRQQALTMPRSKCYTESSGELSCVTCHNPHQNAETSSTYYEEKCLDCHSSRPRPTSRARPPKADAVRAPVVCPVNATKGCVNCHMPKVESRDEHATFADHHIRVHGRKTQARALREIGNRD